MRLDAYLVDMGYFKSRGRAKTAVLAGSVKVNGAVVKKVSRDVTSEDEIEVAEGLDRPQGYFKLKRIQEESGIIKPGDRVLDLGSSAGGFILFASEIAGYIKGIEFSRDFRSELGKIAFERENVEVMFGDVFTVPLNTLSEEPVDAILSDMTLEPQDSIKALGRVLPLLKENGKILQVIKMPKKKNPKPTLSKIEDLGLEILQVISSEKQEIYVIARKTGNGEKEPEYEGIKAEYGEIETEYGEIETEYGEMEPEYKETETECEETETEYEETETEYEETETEYEETETEYLEIETEYGEIESEYEERETEYKEIEKEDMEKNAN